MTHKTLHEIRAMDARDPLAAFRERFSLPEGVVYLDGNSLGALPAATTGRMEHLIKTEWGRDLIRSWKTHDWIGAPRRVGDKIAKLIGADAGEVIVSDSTSINLCKLIHAAIEARPGRGVILSEPGNFPTDLYVAQGVIRSLGNRHTLRLETPERLIDAIDENTALLLLTHVHYKTAHVHDMHALTEAAHARGALVLWDLSHSAGAIDVALNAAQADLAVGCGYKYLNGGPGAPAFMFVACRHHDSMHPAMCGWMGHARPFDFIDQYEPAAGVQRFLCGTPPVMAIAALEVGVDLLVEAGTAALVEKSRKLAELMISLVEERCGAHGLRLIGPRDLRGRGSHVAFSHPDGYPIMQALIEHGVIGDFRAPDAIRFGLTPLYTRYQDIWDAVERLHEILRSGCWREPKYSVRGPVS